MNFDIFSLLLFVMIIIGLIWAIVDAARNEF
jgi:hypothetical protein